MAVGATIAPERATEQPPALLDSPRPCELFAYFAYGSNLNRRDFALRCADAVPGVRAQLVGWRLVFRDVADIVPARSRAVHGALWWVSADDIGCLDRYEGAPRKYRQAIVACGPSTAGCSR